MTIPHFTKHVVLVIFELRNKGMLTLNNIRKNTHIGIDLLLSLVEAGIIEELPFSHPAPQYLPSRPHQSPYHGNSSRTSSYYYPPKGKSYVAQSPPYYEQAPPPNQLSHMFPHWARREDYWDGRGYPCPRREGPRQEFQQNRGYPYPGWLPEMQSLKDRLRALELIHCPPAPVPNAPVRSSYTLAKEVHSSDMGGPPTSRAYKSLGREGLGRLGEEVTASTPPQLSPKEGIDQLGEQAIALTPNPNIAQSPSAPALKLDEEDRSVSNTGHVAQVAITPSAASIPVVDTYLPDNHAKTFAQGISSVVPTSGVYRKCVGPPMGTKSNISISFSLFSNPKSPDPVGPPQMSPLTRQTLHVGHQTPVTQAPPVVSSANLPAPPSYPVHEVAPPQSSLDKAQSVPPGPPQTRPLQLETNTLSFHRPPGGPRQLLPDPQGRPTNFQTPQTPDPIWWQDPRQGNPPQGDNRRSSSQSVGRSVAPLAGFPDDSLPPSVSHSPHSHRDGNPSRERGRGRHRADSGSRRSRMHNSSSDRSNRQGFESGRRPRQKRSDSEDLRSDREGRRLTRHTCRFLSCLVELVCFKPPQGNLDRWLEELRPYDRGRTSQLIQGRVISSKC